MKKRCIAVAYLLVFLVAFSPLAMPSVAVLGDDTTDDEILIDDTANVELLVPPEILNDGLQTTTSAALSIENTELNMEIENYQHQSLEVFDPYHISNENISLDIFTPSTQSVFVGDSPFLIDMDVTVTDETSDIYLVRYEILYNGEPMLENNFLNYEYEPTENSHFPILEPFEKITDTRQAGAYGITYLLLNARFADMGQFHVVVYYTVNGEEQMIATNPISLIVTEIDDDYVIPFTTASNMVQIAEREFTNHGNRALANPNKYQRVSGASWSFHDAWCAMFVSYVAMSANVPTNVIPRSAQVGTFRTFAQNNNRLISRTSSPRAGDMAIWGGHINIVVSVNGNNVTTVGGNESNQVRRLTWNWNTSVDSPGPGGGTFRGWFRPAYSQTVTPPSITGVTVNPASVPFGGGSSTITVTGTNLVPGNMRIALFRNNNETPISPGTPGGSASSVSITYTYHENTTTANLIYTVRVSLNGGSSWLSSPSATVTHLARPATPPSITIQPQNRTITAGQSTALWVSASGTAPLGYRWELSTNNGGTWSTVSNGGIYSGATTDALSLNNVPTNRNGDRYRVIVSNSAGSVTSNAVTLTVNAVPPSISTQPPNRTITAGQNTTFSVTTSGTESLTYRWERAVHNGAWENVSNGDIYSGATTATLTLTNVPIERNGNRYRVIVSNSTGSVTSNPATLTVNSRVPYTPTVNVIHESGTVEVNWNFIEEATHYEVVLVEPPWNWADFIESATKSSPHQNSHTFNNIAAGDYAVYVIAYPHSEQQRSEWTFFTVNPLPPSITSQPQNRIFAEGSNTTFSVTATGTNLTYQWELSSDNGATWSAISNWRGYSGETTPTLMLTNVPSTFSGDKYRVVITNTEGTVISNTVTLTVGESILGDINGDGRVTSADSTWLARHLVKHDGFDTIDSYAADINNDGEIDTKDITALARWLIFGIR